jgi:hypothetical protein
VRAVEDARPREEELVVRTLVVREDAVVVASVLVPVTTKVFVVVAFCEVRLVKDAARAERRVEK